VSLILHVETATRVCSVALSMNGILLNEISEQGEGYVHGERLTLIMQEVMKNSKKEFDQLDAVSISIGPGSYTGLRIGLSTVKGIAFALRCPIIELNTLEIIANSVSHSGNIFAMLDARRMEVYTHGIDGHKNTLFNSSPMILDEWTFAEFDPILCVGDGAEKTKEIWKDRKIIYFDEFELKASLQIERAVQKFEMNLFSDPSSIVPKYLKEFEIKKA